MTSTYYYKSTMQLRWFTAICAILIASCSEPEGDAAGSLVDFGEVPSVSMFSAETIEITQIHGEVAYAGFQLLSYELTPDNILRVVHLYRGEVDQVLAQEEFQLSEQIGFELREQLAPLRPKEFENLEQMRIVRPHGCEQRILHSDGEMTVLFHNDNLTPNDAEDDQFAVFEVPRKLNCDSPASQVARKVLLKVIEQLPNSDTAENYPVAM